jgi:hypothetical protein
MLTEIGPHLDELNRIFGSTEALLNVALGLEDNEAFSKIESWVNSPAAKPKKKGKKAPRGIARVVKKITNLMAKIKGVLKPLFAARQKVNEAFGAVTGLVFAVEGLDQIFDMRDDQGSDDFRELVDAYSRDLSGKIQEKLDGLRESLQLASVSFDKSEMITAEEVGQALLQAIKQFAPKPVKGALKLLEKVGATFVEDALTNYVLAKLIPQSVIDSINKKLSSALSKLTGEFIGAVQGDLDKLLLSAGKELESGLVPKIKEALLQLDASVPGAPPPPAKVRAAVAMLPANGGRPLPGRERREFELTWGFDLSRVRIFDDSRSHRAAAALGANAFTFRRNIYFGAGQYQPNTAEGRRILAHELTHTEQQSSGTAASLIQPDYASVLKKLVENFGERVRKSLIKIAGRKNEPKQKEAAEKILKRVSPLIGGAVFSKTRPDIEATSTRAYRYVLGGGGKPKGVRRKTKWLGLLPAISIAKKPGKKKPRRPGAVGYLSYGFRRAFDPNRADRVALRSALNGCGGKAEVQAHHLIPLKHRNHEIVKAAAKNGFGFNDKVNGECLGPLTHKGDHPNYSTRVREMLDSLLVQHPDLKWEEIRPDFEERMKKLRKAVRRANKKGDSIETVGPIK